MMRPWTKAIRAMMMWLDFSMDTYSTCKTECRYRRFSHDGWTMKNSIKKKRTFVFVTPN